MYTKKSKKIIAFFRHVVHTRYFWMHLARSDLKMRFRRSKLGMLWHVLNPLLLTLLISIVFGAIFNMEIKEYAPYILSGMVVWDVLTSSVVGGGNAFMASEQYIRQINHRKPIYTLRLAILYIATFCLAVISLIIWILLLKPENVILGFITLPLTIILLFLLSWPLVTIASYTNVKYRDYPQMMALVMQALWYMSPVFLRESMFAGHAQLALILRINPVTHILNLLRMPFLYGQMPSPTDYAFTFGTIILVCASAFLTNKKNEHEVIFYL